MLRFFERRYPSANAMLLEGERPILVDPGFGADADELFAWLGATVPSLIVNTHWHSDHAGANAAAAARFGAPIATGSVEAARIAAGDADAGDAAWLRQEIAPYRVDQPLEAGDVLETGRAEWHVLPTPGHTAGHLSLFAPASGILVLGDALHEADVGWLSPRRPESLAETAATLERIACLPATIGYSGHGRAIHDLPAALERARRRITAWRHDPELVGWHACKRIFAHALMLEDGLPEVALAPFLLGCRWFVDHARLVFGMAPAALVPRLVAEMLRADAAYWEAGVLCARAPYRAPTHAPARR